MIRRRPQAPPRPRRTKKPEPEKEKITVDLSDLGANAPKAKEAKTEAPRVNTVKTEPARTERESLVIKELSEQINVKDVSEKIEQIDAPVSSNAKQ